MENENIEFIEEDFKAILLEDNPIYKRGNKIMITEKDIKKEVVIRSIYSRRLEDLTFSDLEMIGYTNPNLFVREWESVHGSFDKDKIVWVVIYVDDKMKGGRKK